MEEKEMSAIPMGKVVPNKDGKPCSICQEPIAREMIGIHMDGTIIWWDEGHNARPINDGRCCKFCNDNVVIQQRILMISKDENYDYNK